MRGLITISCFVFLAAPAFAQVEIEVVLDSSQFMAVPTADGTQRFATARTALGSWILGLPRDDGLRLGLRIAGGDKLATDPGACDDTSLLIPPAAIDHGSWWTVLRGLRPQGQRPLIAAVVQAAGDFSPDGARRRIVLLTSGDDMCHSDPRSAAAVLAAGNELRIVGIQLDAQAVDRFSAIVPTRNAATIEELRTALDWSVEDLVTSPGPGGSLRVELRQEGDPIDGWTQRLVDVVTAFVHEPGNTETIPPGLYRLELEHPDLGRREFDNLRIATTGDLELELSLADGPPPTLAVVPELPAPGNEVLISYWGAPPGDHRIEIASSAAPSWDWVADAPTRDVNGSALIRLPDDVKDLEIRFQQLLDKGLSRTVARLPTSILEPHITLEAPPEAHAFDVLDLAWSGPDNPGDHIVISRPEDPSTEFASCQFTGAGNPTRITTPGDSGAWEIRYVSGLSGRIFARRQLELVDFSATLEAPDQVFAGRSFEVVWSGRSRPDDYLTLASAGSDKATYISFHPTIRGSPAQFVAPHQAGIYEIRYVNDDDDLAVAKLEFEVIAVPARLDTPPAADVGTRFEVEWEGPDADGDFISIARTSDHPGGRLDFFFTSLGSPATLAAPLKPGNFEIRYVDGANRRVLASVPIRID